MCIRDSYITIAVQNVQFEVCVVEIKNLICDVLLGVDVLQQIHAEVDIRERLLKCYINDNSYIFNLNTTHTPTQE